MFRGGRGYIYEKANKENPITYFSFRTLLDHLSQDELKKVNTSPIWVYEYIDWEKPHQLSSFALSSAPVNRAFVFYNEISNVGNLRQLYKLSKKDDSDFARMIASDYYSSWVQEKREIIDKIKDSYKLIVPNNSDNILHEWVVNNVQYKVIIDDWNINIQVTIDEENELFSSLKEMEWNREMWYTDNPTLTKMQAVYLSVAKELIENANAMKWKINKRRLFFLNSYTQILNILQADEKFKKGKPKTFIDNLQVEIAKLSEMSIDVPESLLDATISSRLDHLMNYNPTYSSGKTDLMDISDLTQIEKVLYHKCYHNLPHDLDEYGSKMKLEKKVTEGFRTYWKITHQTPEMDVSNIQTIVTKLWNLKTDSKNVVNAIQREYTFSPKLKVGTITVDKHEWTHFENQVDRSKRYAESLYKLTNIRTLHKQIMEWEIDYNNVWDFKELVGKYKMLAEDIASNYSWEGGLIVTKDVITAILTYVSTTPWLTEDEEREFRSRLYSNTRNLLNTILEKKDNTSSELNKIIGTLESSCNLWFGSLFQVWEACSVALSKLDELWIDVQNTNYSIWNVEWRGAYFTPDAFSNFLKPFLEDVQFVWQVSVLDPSCWKGTLLSYVNGENVKKVWNDVNTLSLEILKYTQGLNYEKLLSTENIEEMKYYVSNSSLISTLWSSENYLDSWVSFDVLLSNPPYINQSIDRKTINVLKENWLKNFVNGKVNMSELTYRALSQNLKLWGLGMNILSARGLSKTELKSKFSDWTYLVPLYRIWVNGDPFKAEGVELAPIDISWDDVYTYRNWELVKWSWKAEFFVTIYTRLEKSQQDVFENSCPTILVNNKDISNIWVFLKHEVFEKLNTLGIFSNIKNYNHARNYYTLNAIQDFEKQKWKELWALKDILEKESIINEDVERFLWSYGSLQEYMIYKSNIDKSIGKLKFHKPIKENTQIINESLNLLDRIHVKYTPYTMEAMKTIINEASLKIVLEREFGLIDNSYSFRPWVDSKVINRWGKFYFEDYDISKLLTHPFPFSLQLLDLRTYKFVLGKYLLNVGDGQLLNDKLSTIKNIVDYYSHIEDKSPLFTVKGIGGIWWSSNIEKVIDKLIEDKNRICSLKTSTIDEYLVGYLSFGINVERLKELVVYLNNNPKSFELLGKDEGFLNKLASGNIITFPKWCILKLKDDSFWTNVSKSTQGLYNYIQKYAQDKGVIAFDSVLFDWKTPRKYRNNYELLNALSNVLIHEYNQWNDYFSMVIPFAKHSSQSLKEFSKIVNYSKFNEIQRIDGYFDSIAHIEKDFKNLEYLVNRTQSKLRKKVNFTEFTDLLSEKHKDSYALHSESVVQWARDFLIENHTISQESKDQIREMYDKLKYNITTIKIPEVRNLYIRNIDSIRKNIETLLNMEVKLVNSELMLSNLRDLPPLTSSYLKSPQTLIKLHDFLEASIVKNKEDLVLNELVDIKNLIKSNIATGTKVENVKLESFDRSYFSDSVYQSQEKKKGMDKQIRTESKALFEKRILKEMEDLNWESDNGMLLNIYNESVVSFIQKEFSSRIVFIDNTINHFLSLESKLDDLKNIWVNDSITLDELYDTLNYAKFMTANLDGADKIIALGFIAKNGDERDWMKEFILNTDLPFNSMIDYDRIDALFKQRHDDYERYGKNMADSITASLWVRSNYTKLYTSVLLDIETEILNKKDYSVFKEDYMEFSKYIDSISPYEEEIKLSTKLASVLEKRSLLNKKNVLFQDLLEIDNVEEYISNNGLDDLDEEEKIAIILWDKDFIKSLKEEQNLLIRQVNQAITELDVENLENKEKMKPTLMQMKALYHFKKWLEGNKDLYKMLNQSEVGTGKTFTMPFYNKILDDFYKNDSIKIFFTEANLVANTTKSLIENGIHPSDIHEGKLSDIKDVDSITQFIKKGGKNVILSSATLQSFDPKNIDVLSKYLKKGDKNVYVYCDEATFLKNTESQAYEWFLYFQGKMKKSNKLKLVNYLTATPVNNDNGDFLYLFNLMNKKDVLKMVKELSNSRDDYKDLYKVISILPNLRLGNKESRYNDSNKTYTYYFVPNIVSLLEFIRTGHVHVNLLTQIKDPYIKDKYLALREYYVNMWISIPKITEDEFRDPRYIPKDSLAFNSRDTDLSNTLIDLYKHLNIINFDRNLNSLGFDGTKSQLLKTYYSLNPSLLESYLIEVFIKELNAVQNFKKFSENLWKVIDIGNTDLDTLFKTESANIMSNLILAVSEQCWLSITKDEYSIKFKVKKGFSETTESRSFPKFTLNKDLLINTLNADDWDGYLYNNKFLDAVFQSIDVISYSNFKTSLNNLKALKEKWVRESILKKEENIARKYLDNISSIISNFMGVKISFKTDKEDVVRYFSDFIEMCSKGTDSVQTVEGTYKDDPASFLGKVHISKESPDYKKFSKILESLSKNEEFSGFSERRYLIQLLEDFNSPLVSLFVDKSLKGIVNDAKEYWCQITLSDEESQEIKDYILSKWNTLSGTLINIAQKNSKDEINSLILVNFVNTVHNLEKEIRKLNSKISFITSKDCSTSKEKLKIVSDFDKLEDFGKVLVSTTKSIEKGVSIFNSLKWYTTVWDENAWALTQRLGRFRTLMKSQLSKLEDVKTAIEKGNLDFKWENEKILRNINALLTNSKEFFIIGNKLSEGLLQRSEAKNILLQKVNATSLFKWLTDFNDNYFGVNHWSFNVSWVLNSIEGIIKNEKDWFFERIKTFGCEIPWWILSSEIKRNIETNIRRNIDNMALIENIKSDYPPPEKVSWFSL